MLQVAPLHAPTRNPQKRMVKDELANPNIREHNANNEKNPISDNRLPTLSTVKAARMEPGIWLKEMIKTNKKELAILYPLAIRIDGNQMKIPWKRKFNENQRVQMENVRQRNARDQIPILSALIWEIP